MPEYQEILDTEVQPEAPLTSSLGVRFRDNPIALANGASGAPRIQTAALDDSAVTQAKLASNATGRPQLKTGTNSVSGTLSAGSRTIISLTDYSLFPSITSGSNEIVVRASSTSASPSSPVFTLFNVGSTVSTYEVAWRFVQT